PTAPLLDTLVKRLELLQFVERNRIRIVSLVHLVLHGPLFTAKQVTKLTVTFPLEPEVLSYDTRFSSGGFRREPLDVLDEAVYQTFNGRILMIGTDLVLGIAQ